MDADAVLFNLRFGVGFNLDSIGLGQWRIFFNPDADNCENSSTITVERIGVEDIWVIEAGGPFNSARACLLRGERGGAFTFHGLYHMPFQIEVQAK